MPTIRTPSRTLSLRIALLGALATVLAVVVPAGPAAADERRCRGSIGARSIDDDVYVPRNGNCRLVGTRVDGNVKVRPGGRLVIENGARIGGNVQTEGAARTVVREGSLVKGDVQHERGREHIVRDARVQGNIQVEDAREVVRVLRNVVDGDIQLWDNDGIRVIANRVDGNLQCKGNDAPISGRNNRVEGNKEDQCRRM